VTEFLSIHVVSTRMNPMFRKRRVPYAWTLVVDADEADRVKAEVEARWLDVTARICVYR
jgi:hypothetical protein